MRISRVVMAPGGMPVSLSTLIALKIPLVGQSVHAGFPSPADDFLESMIDLNQVLISNPVATYMWRVVGDCMIDVKIFPGDVVLGAVTRSFGSRVIMKVEMEQAVAVYATKLGEKLRRHNLATDHVTVFMHTSKFNDDEPQRSVSMTVDIPEATNDSPTLIKAARRAVDTLWLSGFRYSKAGIITQDLVPPPIPQRALFDNLDHEKAAKVMAAMDEANRRWGRATVVPAVTMGGPAKQQTFSTKFEMRSPRFTTRWEELPQCR